MSTAIQLAADQARRAIRRASQLREQLAPELPIPPDLAPDDTELPESTDATAGAIVFTRAEPETWTVHRVERQVAAARADIDAAIVALRAAGGTRAWVSVDALTRVATGLLELGREVNTGRARVVPYIVPSDGNAAMVAFWLYGDSGRRHEIVSLNRISDPNLIASGTELQVYER